MDIHIDYWINNYFFNTNLYNSNLPRLMNLTMYDAKRINNYFFYTNLYNSNLPRNNEKERNNKKYRKYEHSDWLLNK